MEFFNDYLIVGTTTGTYWSNDMGVSFNRSYDADYTSQVFAVKGDRLYLGKEDGRGFKSSTDGSSFTSYANYPHWPWTYGIAFVNGKIFTATDNAIYMSSDNGNSWSSVGPQGATGFHSILYDGTN